jgi:hypothetical protein
VVVAAGETLRVPEAATVPMPWLMLTDVALVVDQVRVDAAPEVIDAGDAVSDAVGRGVPAVTVTVALALAEPALFVAVAV